MITPRFNKGKFKSKDLSLEMSRIAQSGPKWKRQLKAHLAHQIVKRKKEQTK